VSYRDRLIGSECRLRSAEAGHGGTVGAGLLGAVLAPFAEAVRAAERKRIAVVPDNAGWHVSSQLIVPPRISPPARQATK